MSELAYESPLAGVAEPQGLSITLREITDRGMIDLRGLAALADERHTSAGGQQGLGRLAHFELRHGQMVRAGNGNL